VDDDVECKRRSVCIQEDKQKYEKYSKLGIKPGCKIRFKGEKRFYNVRACDDRFIIAYRNWRDTYYYVICDLKECIRGADNYSSCGGYYDYKNCPEIELEEALYRLNMGEDKLLKDCLDMPENIKTRYLAEINFWEQVPEDKQWVEHLGISHRRWTELDIEEVKEK
jgi:hypothetical protein